MKIFANEMTNKGLRANTYTAHTTQHQKKKKNPDLKMGRRAEKTFSQKRNGDGQAANEKMRMSLTRKILTQTTVGRRLTPVRMAVIKRSMDGRCW